MMVAVAVVIAMNQIEQVMALDKQKAAHSRLAASKRSAASKQHLNGS